MPLNILKRPGFNELGKWSVVVSRCVDVIEMAENLTEVMGRPMIHLPNGIAGWVLDTPIADIPYFILTPKDLQEGQYSRYDHDCHAGKDNILINAVLDDFIRFYKRVDINHLYGDEPFADKAAAVMRINSGDCGTAAIACGLVLNALGIKVRYFDNYNHAFLRFAGVFYDTQFPSGCLFSDQLVNAGMDDSLDEEVTVTELVKRYIEPDPIGKVLVFKFIERYGIGKDHGDIPSNLTYPQLPPEGHRNYHNAVEFHNHIETIPLNPPPFSAGGYVL